MIPVTTTASIEFQYPPDVQLSSPPLSGKFWVECHNTDGATYATRDMGPGTDASSFKAILEADCAFLAGKISVSTRTANYARTSMGVEYEIKFKKMNASVN